MPTGIYIRTKEHNQKISKANKGKPSSHKGKPLSVEHRRKMGEAHKGYHFSEEAKIKISNALKGRTMSETAKAKMREAAQDLFREKNHNWKGGYFLRSDYIFVQAREHPKADKDGYVKRARLVLEEKLGRYLLPGMGSHHINGIKEDDRPENLMELSQGEHVRLHLPHKGKLRRLMRLKQ